MGQIRVRIYCDTEEFSREGYVEEQDIIRLDKIPIADVINLEMYPVVEGKKMKESGDIQKKFCCVKSRKIITENNERIMIIHGHLC